MKTMWIIGQLLFLAIAIFYVILKQYNIANQYLILSFEMAILNKLENR